MTGVDLELVKERFRNEIPAKPAAKPKVKPPKPETRSAETYPATPAESSYRRPAAMAPLPTEVLPGVVRDYLRYAAATCSCEPAAPFMHVIALAAGLIGNTHRIELAPEFVEPSVLWSVTIGSSGKGKTPPFRAVMNLIKPLEENLQEINAAAKEAHAIEKAHHSLALKVWQKKPQGDPPPTPERPPSLTIHSTDSTIEGLAWMHQNNWRGLTFTRSELSGWVESFGAYTGAKGRDLSQWLELHDGSTLKVDRKGADPETGSRTLYIPLTSVSLTGTIQPRVMQSVFGDRAHDSGLVARILTIWPRWEFTPWQGSDARQANHFADSYRGQMEELLRKLYELQPAEDPRGRPTPHLIRLSRDAESVWEPYYNATRKRSFTFCEDSETFLANAWPKLLGAAARIALVVHGIRKAIGEPVGELLGPDDMQAGVTIAEWLKGETERVFDLMYRTPAERELDMILELADEAGGNSRRASSRGGTEEICRSRRWPRRR